MPLIIGGGVALGGIMGGMDYAEKKKRYGDSGNPWAGKIHDASTQAMEDYLKRGHSAGSQEFLDDPLLGKSYQQGQASLADIMGDVGGSRANLADMQARGYGYTPQDNEALGQAYADIARQGALGDQSLAQAMSNRGLSSSGMAGRAFAGAYGNKAEQMRAAQRQIADLSMQRTFQRLQNAQQFHNQMLGQQLSMLSNQQGFGLKGSQAKDQFAQDKAQMANVNLQNLANQGNLNWSQKQATAPGSFMSNVAGGAIKGGMAAGSMAAGGGMGGGGGEMQAAQALAQSENANPNSNVNRMRNNPGGSRY